MFFVVSVAIALSVGYMERSMARPLSKRERRENMIRHDTLGAVAVGYWVGLVVTSIVLLLIVAALIPNLNQALFNYSNNETVFGPILKTIVPILIGAGILLLFVSVYISEVRSAA